MRKAMEPKGTKLGAGRPRQNCMLLCRPHGESSGTLMLWSGLHRGFEYIPQKVLLAVTLGWSTKYVGVV